MKKFPLFLSANLLLGSVAFLGGCSSSNNKVDLMYGDLHASVSTLSYDKLKEKVDSKQTFLLVVQYSDGCICWSHEAKPVLDKFTEEQHVQVYHIKLEDLDAHENRFDIEIIQGNVTFAIFEEGKVKKCVTTSDSDTLKKYESFMSFMTSMVNFPRIYYVSLDDVDRLYRTEEKNIIYFGRSTCGDCGYIESHFLKDWSKSNPNYSKKIYLLDCDQTDIRLDDEGKYNAEQWQTFKDDYGLSTKHNPTYGYDNGYVPTFFLIQGNIAGVNFLSGCVSFNDSLEISGDGYVVSNSYFTNERVSALSYIDAKVEQKVLKGLSVPTSDVTLYGTYPMWNHEAAEKYHNVYLENFLKFAEKQ